MSTDLHLGTPQDSPCWACGQSPSAPIKNGGSMVYMRVCIDCLRVVGELSWEEPNWIKKKPNVKAQNQEVVYTYNQLWGQDRPVQWSRVGAQLKILRRIYTQEELLAAIKATKDDGWMQKAKPPVEQWLSQPLVERFDRVAKGIAEKNKDDDRARLSAEKLRMVKELFGADLLTEETERKVSEAESVNELEQLRLTMGVKE